MSEKETGPEKFQDKASASLQEVKDTPEKQVLLQEMVGDIWETLKNQAYSEGYEPGAVQRLARLVHKWDLPRNLYKPIVLEIATGNFGYVMSNVQEDRSQALAIQVKKEFPEFVDMILAQWAKKLIEKLDQAKLKDAARIFAAGSTDKRFFDVLEEADVRKYMRRCFALNMLTDTYFLAEPLEGFMKSYAEEIRKKIQPLVSAFVSRDDIPTIIQEASVIGLTTLKTLVDERADETDRQRLERSSDQGEALIGFLFQAHYKPGLLQRYPPDQNLLRGMGFDLASVSKLRETLNRMETDSFGIIKSLRLDKEPALKGFNLLESILTQEAST